ncbi:hypothetical protein RHMOL_Rhmol02G0117500 [Rhododendron molle]|uniref:Uncharacterized protein n=1 Tax=Rhododendron molle TaxID=49168 RepID=A0ACC0PQG0_RHOML|nr:hypothetical protein RHMOL_Rhmol02G0117500 [Rhododendron molle]
MASEAPSWADQWGKGGVGAMGEEDNGTTVKESGSNKKATGTSAGLSKAKSVAMAGAQKVKSGTVAGAQKVKSGTSTGFNWIKNKCQKKNSPQ